MTDEQTNELDRLVAEQVNSKVYVTFDPWSGPEVAAEETEITFGPYAEVDLFGDELRVREAGTERGGREKVLAVRRDDGLWRVEDGGEPLVCLTVRVRSAPPPPYVSPHELRPPW
jgi:hypothetical protein